MCVHFLSIVCARALSNSLNHSLVYTTDTLARRERPTPSANSSSHRRLPPSGKSKNPDTLSSGLTP